MKQILLLAALLITTNSFAQQTAVNYQKKGAPMPNFYVDRTDGGYLIPSLLKKGKPVMIMIFSPQCEHCAYVIDSIKLSREDFKTTQLIIVAEERNKEFMEGFIEKAQIKGDALFKNIGTNKGELIAAIYTNKILPQLVFYDANHKLVKIFDGNYKFSEVKPYIK
jgi:thiol-disulfide isomerase/thioredoxin